MLVKTGALVTIGRRLEVDLVHLQAQAAVRLHLAQAAVLAALPAQAAHPVRAVHPARPAAQALPVS